MNAPDRVGQLPSLHQPLQRKQSLRHGSSPLAGAQAAIASQRTAAASLSSSKTTNDFFSKEAEKLHPGCFKFEKNNQAALFLLEPIEPQLQTLDFFKTLENSSYDFHLHVNLKSIEKNARFLTLIQVQLKKQLKSLTVIPTNEKISTDTLKQFSIFLKNVPCITDLTLANCHHIPAQELMQIVTACEESLERLDLSCCFQLGDKELNQMACLFSGTRKTYLQSLNLSSCAQCSENSIKTFILQAGNKLTHIDVSECQITDHLLEEIKKAISLDVLQAFEMRKCKNVTAKGFNAFWTQFCRSLKTLDVSDSDLPANEIIPLICKYQAESRLTALKIRGIPEWNEAALQFLSQGLNTLEEVDISKLPVTYEQVVTILKKGVKLTRLFYQPPQGDIVLPSLSDSRVLLSLANQSMPASHAEKICRHLLDNHVLNRDLVNEIIQFASRYPLEGIVEEAKGHLSGEDSARKQRLAEMKSKLKAKQDLRREAVGRKREGFAPLTRRDTIGSVVTEALPADLLRTKANKKRSTLKIVQPLQASPQLAGRLAMLSTTPERLLTLEISYEALEALEQKSDLMDMLKEALSPHLDKMAILPASKKPSAKCLENIKSLVETFPKLTKLKIDKSISIDSACEIVNAFGKNLKSLNLSDSEFMDFHLRDLSNAIESIDSLSMENCAHISDAGVAEIAKKLKPSKLKSLKLDLSGCAIYLPSLDRVLKDKGISSFILKNYRDLTDNDIENLGYLLGESLEQVDMRGNKLSYDSISRLLKTCKNLKSFLYDTPESSASFQQLLPWILKKFIGIKQPGMTIEHAEALIKQGLEKKIFDFELKKKCIRWLLEFMPLETCIRLFSDHWPADFEKHERFDYKFSILDKKGNLSDWQGIYDTFKALIDVNGFKVSIYLELGPAPLQPDSECAAFIERLIALLDDRIAIIHAKEPSQAMIEAISKCRRLKILMMEGGEMTEQEVHILKESCPDIRSFCFAGTKITDPTCRSFALAYPRLEKLTVNHCPGISEKGSDALASIDMIQENREIKLSEIAPQLSSMDIPALLELLRQNDKYRDEVLRELKKRQDIPLEYLVDLLKLSSEYSENDLFHQSCALLNASFQGLIQYFSDTNGGYINLTNDSLISWKDRSKRQIAYQALSHLVERKNPTFSLDIDADFEKHAYPEVDAFLPAFTSAVTLINFRNGDSKFVQHHLPSLKGLEQLNFKSCRIQDADLTKANGLTGIGIENCSPITYVGLVKAIHLHGNKTRILYDKIEKLGDLEIIASLDELLTLLKLLQQDKKGYLLDIIFETHPITPKTFPNIQEFADKSNFPELKTQCMDSFNRCFGKWMELSCENHVQLFPSFPTKECLQTTYDLTDLEICLRAWLKGNKTLKVAVGNRSFHDDCREDLATITEELKSYITSLTINAPDSFDPPTLKSKANGSRIATHADSAPRILTAAEMVGTSSRLKRDLEWIRDCQSLQEITLDAVAILGADLTHLMSDLKKIRSFGLVNCPHIDLGILSSLILQWKGTLERLKFTDKNNLKKEIDLLNIISPCEKLQLLDLSGCQTLTDKMLAKIGEQSKVLTDLILDGCEQITLEEEGLFPSLRRLSLKQCIKVTDRGLETFGKGALKLKEIYFEANSLVTPKGLYRLASTCLHITSLSLRNFPKFTSKEITQIVSSWNLESLDLKCCHQLDEETLRSIALTFMNLHTIDVSYCDRIPESLGVLLGSKMPLHEAYKAKGLTDASLIILAKKRPNIAHLHIEHSPKITLDGLKMLQYFEQLKSLTLIGQPLSSDKMVEVIAKYSKSLEELHLEEREGGALTNEALKHLIPLGKTLKNLTLLNLPEITSSGFTPLVGKFPKLVELTIKGCKAKSQSLLPFVRSCKQLQDVQVDNPADLRKSMNAL